MKKIIQMVVVFALAGLSLFGQEKKEFNKVQYESEYISDFNDWDDFCNKWMPKWDWILDPGVSAPNSGDVMGMEHNQSIFTKNDTFLATYTGNQCYSVEDGILTFNCNFYRTKNSRGGYKYVSQCPQINCGVWWDDKAHADEGEDKKYPKESYIMKLDGNKLFEIKFKVPKSQYALEVFFMNRECQYGHTELPNTSKGYHIDELDLIELTTISNEQTKKQVKPRGYPTGPSEVWGQSLLMSCNGNTGCTETIRVKDMDEWCNEWHIIDIELTPTSMVCYMDGVKYSERKWDKTLGAVDPDWEWNLRIFPGVFGCWENKIDWDAPDKNAKEFQIDYVKVYKEVK